MVLVSVLGDFHSSVLPILYEFKDKITKHILVYDDAKKELQNARTIAKGIEKFSQKHHLHFEQLHYKVDEDSIEALSKCASYIRTLSENPKNIFINTTDGYATLTTILHHQLFSAQINFIAYDMYDNQYNILNTQGLVTKEMQQTMSIVDHFVLKGLEVETSQMKHFAKSHKWEIMNLFENMSSLYDKFLQLSSQRAMLVCELHSEFLPLKDIFLTMDPECGYLSIKNALFTGNLFECYIYLLLEEMGFDDIEVGIKVYQQYKNSKIQNEFDILLMKENHLHMIECKYKNHVTLEELVYKYIALANIIDEDGKMAIVTKKPPVYNLQIDQDKQKGLHYKRGRLHNIFFFGNAHNNPMKFQKELKQHFLG